MLILLVKRGGGVQNWAKSAYIVLARSLLRCELTSCNKQSEHFDAVQEEDLVKQMDKKQISFLERSTC